MNSLIDLSIGIILTVQTTLTYFMHCTSFVLIYSNFLNGAGVCVSVMETCSNILLWQYTEILYLQEEEEEAFGTTEVIVAWVVVSLRRYE